MEPDGSLKSFVNVVKDIGEFKRASLFSVHVDIPDGDKLAFLIHRISIMASGDGYFDVYACESGPDFEDIFTEIAANEGKIKFRLDTFSKTGDLLKSEHYYQKVENVEKVLDWSNMGVLSIRIYLT